MSAPSVTDACLDLILDAERHPRGPWTDLAERAFLDTIGVLIAGSDDPAVSAVASTVEETDGPAVSLATGRRMSARSAALIDGTAAHALDYDDVDDAVIAHPSAVLVPVLVAAGLQQSANGPSLVDAFRAGVRVNRLLAEALGIREHYELGWHSTSTIGTVGAAAAVSRLLGLTPNQTRNALGIAGSLAAGSRRAFGTMTKPLHCGTAASNGLLAAQLARGGMTSDPDLLGGELGFIALHGSDAGFSPADHDSDTPALNTKYFPCCYYTHSAAEAALTLSADSDTSIVEVDVAVQPGGLAPLIHHRPADASQAKFSMEFVVAAALLRGEINLRTFDDTHVRAADITDLIPRIQTRTVSSPPVGPRTDGPFAVVTITGADGRRQSARVDHPAGHASRPIDDVRLHAKFLDCTAGRLGTDTARGAYEFIRHLRDLRCVEDLITAVGHDETQRTRTTGRVTQ
ncbi:MmgE/PrpD family protein [Gordonia terrae]|uniref:MmgE/PrpD family protein n=1 Tax=Gordonia terrae TaxID=2055 RepID=UPI002009FE51|nr:MmgE/PrpD family protein [Gordonia terrae]UPW08072.1 MmgE/PrpD family protein [Gordonia terrae]